MTELFIIIYVVFLLVYGVFSAAGIYHLQRYGYSGDLSKIAIILYVFASIAAIMPVVIWLSTSSFR